MKTTFEVTLRVTVKHSKKQPLVDSNSVKAAINRGVDGIANADLCVYGEGETAPKSVHVKVTKLKENGKRQALSLFGTSDVPWGEA